MSGLELRDGRRYETCEQCGKEWNVSIHARFYAGVYICPRCRDKNRKERKDRD